MADESKDKTCKNPACSCVVEGDNEFCSATCEGAGSSDTIEIDCDCPHPECQGNF